MSKYPKFGSSDGKSSNSAWWIVTVSASRTYLNRFPTGYGLYAVALTAARKFLSWFLDEILRDDTMLDGRPGTMLGLYKVHCSDQAVAIHM